MSMDSTATSSGMLVQLSTDGGNPKLICNICNKALVSLNGYMKHIKKHEPPGGFFCCFCDNRFCTEELLNKHKSAEHTTLACQLCKAIFDTADDYRNHISLIHNGIDRVMNICDKCGAEFKTKEALKRHISTNCGTIKPHKCDQCEMAFYTKYNLAQHKALHVGEKNFCCTYCGKSFLNKGRLVCHERSHTGEKPYKCDICGKCFAHRESIVTHSTIHTGVRNVECLGCDAKFSCHSNLIKHRRSRPDTCGQPQYNPVKKPRGRKPRIPANLMPSEIKVSRLSTIIKPEDLQNKKVLRKRKLKSSSSTQKQIKKHKQIFKNEKLENNIDNQDETEMESELVQPFSNETSEDEDNIPLIKTIKSKSNENMFERNIFEEKDNILDSLLSDKKVDHSLLQTPPIKTEILEVNPEINEFGLFLVEDVKEEDLNTDVLATDNVLDINNAIEDNKNMINLKTPSDKIDLISLQNSLPVKKRKLEEEEDDNNQDNDKPIVHRGRKTRTKSKNVIKSYKESDEESPKSKRDEEKSEKRRRNRGSVLAQLKIMKSLKKGRIYDCKDCVKIYHFKMSYEKHLRQEHEKTEDEIIEIFKGEEPDIPDGMVNKCHICGKIYVMEKRLQTHIKYHGPDGSLIHKCPCYCNRHFVTKEEAYEHAKEVHKNAIYCAECNKFLQGPEALVAHRRSMHQGRRGYNNERNLVCGKCGKRFFSRTYLNDHERSDCGRDPIYKCDICGKGYTTAGILKTHMLLHKEDTPYLCPHCGKAFKVQSQYKTHLRVRHTDQKPFKCSLCPKEYPYRESLLTHMTIHTGQKRYVCMACGTRYSCISNLQAHRKVHASTCGQSPLHSKPLNYMGVQKGVLLTDKPFS